MSRPKRPAAPDANEPRAQPSQAPPDADPRETYERHHALKGLIFASEDDLLLSPPVALNQHPAEILRDLEQESAVLQRLQARISEQLHRLQDEEMTLRKQMSSS